MRKIVPSWRLIFLSGFLIGGGAGLLVGYFVR